LVAASCSFILSAADVLNISSSAVHLFFQQQDVLCLVISKGFYLQLQVFLSPDQQQRLLCVQQLPCQQKIIFLTNGTVPLTLSSARFIFLVSSKVKVPLTVPCQQQGFLFFCSVRVPLVCQHQDLLYLASNKVFLPARINPSTLSAANPLHCQQNASSFFCLVSKKICLP
jgi:hypothetical protein